jgi:hypothetical protein
MARIRTIKPDFWTDETLGECSPTSRLLFVGTWNLADDHGNLERSSRQLKAQLFPYDSIDVEPYVQELLTAGVLIEYQVSGKKYLHIKGFDRHQKVEKKSSPRHPLYEDSLRTHRLLPEPSPTSSGSSLGREGKGREKEGSKSREARASRLPSDWTLTTERRAIAEAEHVDPDRTFAKFTNYWRAASGAKARKVDWDATWQNWCMTETDRKPNGTGAKAPDPIRYRTADEIEAEERARGDYDAQH